MGNRILPNTTQIPNILLDKVMPELNCNELKVLLYLCRRTYGFGKETDKISIEQISNGITTKDGKVLDYGTGLSKPSIYSALKVLVEMGLVKTLKERGEISWYHIDLSYPQSRVESLKILTNKVKNFNKSLRLKKLKILTPTKESNKRIVKQKTIYQNFVDNFIKTKTF